MFADEFKKDVGSFLQTQASDLLAKQLSVSKAVYTERTGMLNAALASDTTAVVDPSGMTVTLSYPLHIRFLDMRRSSRGGSVSVKNALRNHKKVARQVRKGNVKTHYAPIYNRYVYGYLKAAVRRRLRSVVPAYLLKEWTMVGKV